MGTVDFNVRNLTADHILEANVEEFNASLHHLARRGCTFSSERDFWTCDRSVGCGSTVDIRMRQKVVVLSELQRAIIYTTR
jgi:hypothetical protein